MKIGATRIETRYYEDTVVDGEYEHHWQVIDNLEFDTVAELVDAIRRDGCEFDASGSADSAYQVDGSVIIDYGKAEREEISWHIPPGWMGGAPSLVGMLFLIAFTDARPGRGLGAHHMLRQALTR